MDIAQKDYWRLICDEWFTAAKHRTEGLNRLDPSSNVAEVKPYSGPPVVPQYVDGDEGEAELLVE